MARRRRYFFGPSTEQRYTSVVGVNVIWPAFAAAMMSLSEVNCCGAMVLKPICTACHRGLKPSRLASRLVFDGSSLWDAFSLSGGSCSPFLNACKPSPRWPIISGRRPGPKTTRETVHALLLYEGMQDRKSTRLNSSH